jgi:nitrogenase subunit NifH
MIAYLGQAGSTKAHRRRRGFTRNPERFVEGLKRQTALLIAGEYLTLVATNQILKEIRLLRKEVERLEGLIEERLLPMSKRLPDEVDTIKRYVRDKRTGRMEFERLEEL